MRSRNRGKKEETGEPWAEEEEEKEEEVMLMKGERKRRWTPGWNVRGIQGMEEFSSGCREKRRGR